MVVVDTYNNFWWMKRSSCIVEVRARIKKSAILGMTLQQYEENLLGGFYRF